MLPEFLQHLPEQAKQRLLAQAQTMQWVRGQQIVQAEEPAAELFVLQSGHVRLYQLDATKEVTVNVLSSGELLGCGALAEQGRYSLSAEALDDVLALRIEQAELLACVRACPQLTAALGAQVVRQTRNLQERLAQMVFMEVSQRLALALLALLEQQGQSEDTSKPAEFKPIELQGRISHQDLAYVVGSTRETITKLLGEFRARGYLELGYRRIVILSRKGLEQEAEQPITA